MALLSLGSLSRRNHLRLYGGGTLLALLGVVTIVVNFLATSSAPPDVHAPHSIVYTDVNPYGAHFFLEREVETWKRLKTVQMAHDAGIGWARQSFLWEEIEPRRGQFDWSKYDDLVDLYLGNGLNIIARLDRPPAWARKNATTSGASGPPDNLNDYGDFVDAFAKHFRGKIFFYQIWNEPNLAREWNDGPIDPEAYLRMLQVAFRRAKAIDPNIRIMSAPLAITTPGEPYAPGSSQWRNMSDLEFLEALYKGGAQDYFDILSANAFGLNSPPEEAPDPSRLNFRRIELQRQIMDAYGDQAKPVWINEFGWNAAPPSFSAAKLIWGRVDEDRQANYTVRAIDYARKNWPWAGVFSLWYFRQVGDITVDNAEYYFRVVDVDFTPRPVYVRVKEAARALQVAGPGSYQQSTAAAQYQGDWKLRVDSRSQNGTMMAAEGVSARLVFSFWGESLSLITRRGPNAGRLFASIGGQPVPGMERDNTGTSYVDLFSPAEAWQTQVPIVSNLGRGEHTVVLTTDARGEVTIDGFVVGADTTSGFPLAQVLMLGSVGTICLVLFLWTWRSS